MEKLANFCFTMATNTKQLARLKTGFLLREILERFTMKSSSTLSPNRALWIYSAHDGTIANVLNALGLFEVLKTIKITSSFIIFLKLVEPLFILHFNDFRHHTFQLMHRAYFSNFTNSTELFMWKFFTKRIEAKMLNHWNRFSFQIAVKGVRWRNSTKYTKKLFQLTTLRPSAECR